jgi:predicted PurR-regulated permease PerM
MTSRKTAGEEAEQDYGPVPPHAVVPPASTGAPRQLAPEHLYKAAGLLFLFALIFRFFDPLAQVFLIVYASAILAVALNVIVRLFPLERRWVTAILGLTIISMLGLGLWWGVPALMEQVQGFSREAPRLQAQLEAWTLWLRERTGLNIDLFGERSQRILRDFLAGLQGDDMLVRARGVLEILFLPLIILFGGLFAVAKPNDRLLAPLLRSVPRDRRLAFRRLFELLGLRLRGWVKGTLMAMFAVGALMTVTLSIIGVPYALMLGLFAGLVEVVPLAGPWVGGLAAVIIAFLDDPSKALWTVLAVLAIQQLESNIITPLVMARAAEVHPFVTLFALILFGSLFGFLGILLSVPLVLLIWTLVEVLWVERAIDTDEDSIAPVVKE